MTPLNLFASYAEHNRSRSFYVDRADPAAGLAVSTDLYNPDGMMVTVQTGRVDPDIDVAAEAGPAVTLDRGQLLHLSASLLRRAAPARGRRVRVTLEAVEAGRSGGGGIRLQLLDGSTLGLPMVAGMTVTDLDDAFVDPDFVLAAGGAVVTPWGVDRPNYLDPEEGTALADVGHR